MRRRRDIRRRSADGRRDGLLRNRRRRGSASAGAERGQQRLTKHNQRGLQIGDAGLRRSRARGERSLEKKSGLLKRILDVATGQTWIEAGTLRQHLQDGLLQFRRQAIRRRRGAEICKQRRQTILLGGGVRGRRRDGGPLQRRQYIPRRRGARGRIRYRIDRRIGRKGYGIGRRAGAAGRGVRSDHRKPDAIRRLRYRKLQVLAGLERHFRQHIDRKI